MKKTGHIWASFLLGLVVVIPAMLWLTMKAVQTDRLRETDRVETELARREAELQERVNSALYRLDLRLLPLVSQEAARPAFFYDSFYRVPALSVGSVKRSVKGKPQNKPDLIPSPLLEATPEFVKLHFQLDADGKLTSPQIPSESELAFAKTFIKLTPAQIEERKKSRDEAMEFCTFEKLAPICEFGESELLAMASSPTPVMNNSFYQVPAVNRILRENMSQSENSIPQQVAAGGTKLDVQQSRGQSRNFQEFNRRSQTTLGITQQRAGYDQQLANAGWNPNSGVLDSKFSAKTSVMQPVWIDQQLLLARRVNSDGQVKVQGCWLDWKSIEAALRKEVADLFPDIQFEPIRESSKIDITSALTTLPLQILVNKTAMLSNLAVQSDADNQSISGLMFALGLAWLGLIVAVLASAFLLHGVLSLSERRAVFVSAVTHELRTPLTTFRMYAEMLAEKMVPEEKTQQYANTLKVEADRLSHLVENVLQFARLERGSQDNQHEKVLIGDLLSRFTDRLEERCHEAERTLKISIKEEIAGEEVATQPARIEQILFNLVDNACKYAQPAQNKTIELSVATRGRAVVYSVRDFGPGVSDKFKKRMFQAFCKSDQEAADTASGVGLGLALCQRMAGALRGRLYHENCEPGAKFVLEVPRR